LPGEREGGKAPITDGRKGEETNEGRTGVKGHSSTTLQRKGKKPHSTRNWDLDCARQGAILPDDREQIRGELIELQFLEGECGDAIH